MDVPWQTIELDLPVPLLERLEHQSAALRVSLRTVIVALLRTASGAASHGEGGPR
jgi:hypothetical protein